MAATKTPGRRRINMDALATKASACWWIAFVYGEGDYSLLPWLKVSQELKVSQAFRARAERMRRG